MADATNAGIPAAGGQLSGEVTRQAAIRRLQKLQAGPNVGGPPKPGQGLVQTPGQAAYSPHPPKPRRI